MATKSTKPISRSENQSRASFGGRRSHDVAGTIVFWQAFVNGPITAVPLIVEEGAKSKDLQHGANQSSLFESLHLGGNCNRDSLRGDKSSKNLSSAIQYNSLLPERSCLFAHPPQAHQDRINLLVNDKIVDCR